MSETAERLSTSRPACLKRGPGWVLFVITLIGTFSASYPLGSLNVLLPTVAKDLNIDTSLIVLVNIAYSLICGVLTLPFGRWGDRIGYQKLFIMGQIVLLIGGALSTALSLNFILLVLFRCVIAVGAAMVLSVVQAMLAQAFPGIRGRMMGLYSLSISYTGAFSPLISGGIADSFGDWHAALAFGMIFSAAALVLGLIFLGQFDCKPTKADRLGTLLLMLTLSSLLLALNARTITIPVPVMIALLAVFVVALIFFIRTENKAIAPLLDFKLLKNKNFTLGFLGCLLGYTVSNGCSTALPFFIQDIKMQTATVCSLCTMAFPLVMGTFGPFTGAWCDKRGPYKYMLAAMIIQALAVIGYCTLGTESPLALVVICVFLYGLGGGLFYAPITSMVMGSVPPNAGGVASGMMSTARNLGSGIGATIFSLCINLTANADMPFNNYIAGQRADFIIMAALNILNIVFMLILYLNFGRKSKTEEAA